MTSKQQNIIAYQQMLESEFQEFSYPHLIAMGAEIATMQFNTYTVQLQQKSLIKFYPTLQAAIQLLQKVAKDPPAASGPEIDAQQKATSEAARKLDRHINAENFWLLGFLTAITGAIDYIKTEDPLDMVSVYESTLYADDDHDEVKTPEEHQYYRMLAPKYRAQIDLLWKLKTYLKI